MKLRIAKVTFWFFVGLGLTVFILRLINGPGSVTALSDIIPWGLWKGGGVVALVAVGGAGFTLAIFVYIFRWKRYKPLVSGAVLMALLCYSSVGFGLTIDIGIWWRIVFPVFHWQFHSVLFEVAWCIMLYLGVLMFEFSHTALETFGWKALLSIVNKLTIAFVIMGIALSTLHQSSLGTLFLASPFRLHALWHTDLLPLLFFISSIAVGCLTISVVSLVVHWLYNAKPPMNAISGLGKIAAIITTGYIVLKFGEILIAGEGALLFRANWDTFNFWFEIVLSSLIPIGFLFISRYRKSAVAMFWIGICATAGICLNRVNVAGLATLSLTGSDYMPSWTEWAVTLGILSGSALVYLFCVEYFGLFDGIGRKKEPEVYAPGQLDHTDWRALVFGSQRFGEARFYSISFIFAVAFSFLFLSDENIFGTSPEKTAVLKPRMVEIAKTAAPDGSGESYSIWRSGESGKRTTALMIDGNRDGRYVLFDHEVHSGRNNRPGGECALCHHMNKPYDKASGCYECHRDMYLSEEIFDHALHSEKLGGNDHCSDCHTDSSLPKVRKNTTACIECHKGMYRENSRIVIAPAGRQTNACAYKDAMHSLCIGCHDSMGEDEAKKRARLTECTNCHRRLPDLRSSEWERQK